MRLTPAPYAPGSPSRIGILNMTFLFTVTLFLGSALLFAVEPMVNLGTHHTKVLADGWTVVTLDGKPSAHAEHTIAITEEGPEVLTRIASPSPSETVQAASG